MEHIHKLSKQASNFVNLAQYDYGLIGNISVGMPPQNFTVDFDLFYAVDLEIISYVVNYTEPGTVSYDPDASSTYVKKGGNFQSSSTGGSGFTGSDIVNINGLSTNTTFGILNDPGYWYIYAPIDGTFGLHLSTSRNNITSAVEQIVGKLDKPVVSVFSNGTPFTGGTVQVTFGSEDSIHCEDNSGYVPLLKTDDSYSYNYKFHASTVAATINNTDVSLTINATVHLSPFSYEVSCDPAFEQFLINATGAVFNSLTSSYNVNCDAVNGSPVTLNIGEEGNAKVVLTGADYIKYNKYYDVCYLAVVSKPSYAGSLYLGNNFFKNHCFTFNVNDKTIAFSKSKTPTT